MNAQAQSIRDAYRKGYVEALQDGRRERAVTIPAKRGAGSYRRKTKHVYAREIA